MIRNSNFIFISLYLFIGLMPYFESADKEVPQILYLNILNISSFVILGLRYKQNIFKKFSSLINKIPILFFGLFLLISCISVYFSINISESYSKLIELFTVFLSFLFLTYFINKFNNIKKLIFVLIPFLLFIEIFSSLIPYLEDHEVYNMVFKGIILGIVIIITQKMLNI